MKNGNKYTGLFSGNQKNGQGKYEYSDNSSYEGEFKHDLPDGKGKFTDSDGNVYEGSFQDGQMVDGTIYYTNKEKYVG